MNTTISAKRIVIATLFGLVMGGLCAAGTFSSGFLPFSGINLAWVLLNRGIMGFAIAVSGLRLHWAWNGVVIGLVVGSLFSYSLLMSMGPVTIPFVNAVVNGLFGLIIEFFTTVVFKQPAPTATRTSVQPAAA